MNAEEKKVIEALKHRKYARDNYQVAKCLFNKRFQRHTWSNVLYPNLVDAYAEYFIEKINVAKQENKEAELAGVSFRFTGYDVVKGIMKRLFDVEEYHPDEFAKLKKAIFKD
tara:strand:- start:145 stop:480 length:336 start_codon:yes stop_codon:yes gene_type:complete